MRRPASAWASTLLVGALLSLGAAASGWAASQAHVLFGEEQFERTGGSPDIFQRCFAIPSYVSAPYTLRIINGDPEGSRGKAIEGAVSSGHVFIDGVQVVSPNDFSKTVATIEKLLTLEPAAHDGPHSLEVRLARAPGSFIRLTIEGTINRGNLAAARAGHAGTLLADGRVLLTGGADWTDVLDTAEVFDPVTLTSTPLATTLTTPRTEHTATLLPQTETLLVAGEDSIGLLDSTELFNPSSETFRALTLGPRLEILRAGHTATGLLDGRVLIAGGQSPVDVPLGEGEVFDAQSAVVFTPPYDPDSVTSGVRSCNHTTDRAEDHHAVAAAPRMFGSGQPGDGSSAL